MNKELLYTIINRHLDKNPTVKSLDDIFLTGDWEFYTDEFYYNAAHILEDIMRLYDEGEV